MRTKMGRPIGSTSSDKFSRIILLLAICLAATGTESLSIEEGTDRSMSGASVSAIDRSRFHFDEGMEIQRSISRYRHLLENNYDGSRPATLQSGKVVPGEKTRAQAQPQIKDNGGEIDITSEQRRRQEDTLLKAEEGRRKSARTIRPLADTKKMREESEPKLGRRPPASNSREKIMKVDEPVSESEIEEDLHLNTEPQKLNEKHKNIVRDLETRTKVDGERSPKSANTKTALAKESESSSSSPQGKQKHESKVAKQEAETGQLKLRKEEKENPRQRKMKGDQEESHMSSNSRLTEDGEKLAAASTAEKPVAEQRRKQRQEETSRAKEVVDHVSLPRTEPLRSQPKSDEKQQEVILRPRKKPESKTEEEVVDGDQKEQTKNLNGKDLASRSANGPNSGRRGGTEKEYLPRNSERTNSAKPGIKSGPQTITKSDKEALSKSEINSGSPRREHENAEQQLRKSVASGTEILQGRSGAQTEEARSGRSSRSKEQSQGDLENHQEENLTSKNKAKGSDLRQEKGQQIRERRQRNSTSPIKDSSSDPQTIIQRRPVSKTERSRSGKIPDLDQKMSEVTIDEDKAGTKMPSSQHRMGKVEKGEHEDNANQELKEKVSDLRVKKRKQSRPAQIEKQSQQEGIQQQRNLKSEDNVDKSASEIESDQQQKAKSQPQKGPELEKADHTESNSEQQQSSKQTGEVSAESKEKANESKPKSDQKQQQTGEALQQTNSDSGETQESNDKSRGPESEQQQQQSADPTVTVTAEEKKEEPFAFPEPYLLAPDAPIKDWDEQRSRWLEANPHMKSKPDGKPRVLIVTGSQPGPCRSPVGDHFHIKSLKLKIDYARIHNYEIYYNFVWLDPLFGGYWVKLPTIRKLMLTHPEIEWFFWVDSDAFFTDMLFEAPFHKYDGYNMIMWGYSEGFYVRKSWVAFNAGVFLLRNCQWSLDLIDKWSPMGPSGQVQVEYGKILTEYLSDRSENYAADDQSALAYLILHDETVNASVKLIDLTEYMMSGWWIEVVDNYESLIEKWHPGLGDPRWPWITHFTGCSPCGGQSGSEFYEKCLKHVNRAFNFADNQVLAYMGFQHDSLSSPDVHRIKNETVRPLEQFVGVNPWKDRMAQVAAAAATAVS